MKILQINALYGNKSTGSIVRDIHLMLKDSSEESKVVCVSSIGQTDGVIELGYGISNKLHAVITRLNGKQGFYSKSSTRKLISLIDGDSPDVIHLHNTHSNFLNLPIIFDYAAKNKIPVMLTLHDAWYFTGKCYHFLDNGCDRWLTECHDCPKRKADIPSLLFDNSNKVFKSKGEMYSSVDLHVVGCSEWITDCARQSPLFKNASFYQIYNGVDSSVFNPSVSDLKDELGLDGDFTVLTMANKWFDPKNEATARAVLSLVEELHGRLIIVGCNDVQKDGYKDNERVISLGYVTDRVYMARLYKTADVFLNLTLVDTLPTVNIESAMCGTPIVTYNSGGSGELVLNGVTGFITEPLDTDAAILAIKKVYDGSIERNACSEWAYSRFEKNTNYLKYLDLYRKIYESKKVSANGK